MSERPLVAGRRELKDPGGLVLFDEDYQAHIARLDERLARERREVLALREEVAALKETLTQAGRVVG